MRTALLALLLLAAPLALAAPEAAEECAKLRPTAMVNPTELVSGVCSGIRPGAAISSAGGSCTMAWIVTDQHGVVYGTTAGHCASVGTRIRNGGQEIGTMVYSVDQPIGEDFGVFLIDAEDLSKVSAEMCAWGGATGAFGGEGPLAPGVVRHFGFGIGTGTLPPTRARTGVMDYATDTTFAFAGAVAPGDSGSPARLGSGEALGVITDLLSPRSPGTGPLVPADAVLLSQLAIGTRLDHGLARAGAALGLQFTLVTGEPRNEL